MPVPAQSLPLPIKGSIRSRRGAGRTTLIWKSGSDQACRAPINALTLSGAAQLKRCGLLEFLTTARQGCARPALGKHEDPRLTDCGRRRLPSRLIAALNAHYTRTSATTRSVDRMAPSRTLMSMIRIVMIHGSYGQLTEVRLLLRLEGIAARFVLAAALRNLESHGSAGNRGCSKCSQIPHAENTLGEVCRLIFQSDVKHGIGTRRHGIRDLASADGQMNQGDDSAPGKAHWRSGLDSQKPSLEEHRKLRRKREGFLRGACG
ncbi:hypothetical protein NA57DRAFT_58424 [Rhizodiscina lignyota]|uniref:Uncharacterized protein n=1 Tax=Rhizodiscina lignyota TaxID=1504668 RepID=A0A9P4I7N2_9PEZI|nr:hypothetical protein NA57DRAFT_58424 [Rhizodiscina lignyota]